MLTSAALMLRLQQPFDRYIFCELDPLLAEALRARSRRDAPALDVRVLTGDANALVADVIAQIPRGSLTLCFADPFNVKDFRFETLKRLAQGGERVDFLLLIASGMDANRAAADYTKADNPTVDRFVGSSEWRDRWPHERLNFGDFVADEFGRAMKRLGYIYEGLHQTKTQRNTTNSPIYRLAYFSKHERGMEFWVKSLKGTDPQRDLF